MNKENVSLIEDKIIRGVKCKVYYYKKGASSHCINCNKKQDVFVEFDLGGVTQFFCSKCFHKFLKHGEYSSASTLANKKTNYESQDLKYLHGIDYSEAVLKDDSYFYCKYCSKKSKKVIEFPLNSGNKICKNCFKSRYKLLNYSSLKDKSIEEKKEKLEELIFAPLNASEFESFNDNITSRTIKVLGDIEYELTNYKSLHIVNCNRCNISKKTTISVRVSAKGQPTEEICHACYQRILDSTNKNKVENTVVAQDDKPKEFYSKVPLLHPKLAEKKLCVICKKAVVRDKILVSLYNSRNQFVENAFVDSSFCRRCNIGYADNRTIKYLESQHNGLQIDTFKLMKGDLGKETTRSLWSKINARTGEVLKSTSKSPTQSKTDKSNAHQHVTDFVPIGSVIYIGTDDTHPCNGPMVGSLLPYNKTLINNHGLGVDVGLKKCARCQKIFISEARYEKSKHVFGNYKFIEKPVPVHKISPKDFITRVHVFRCTNNDHTLKDIKCIIKLLHPSGKLTEAEIPAAYCSKCKKYYILDSEFRKLKAQGIIVCKVVEKDFWNNNHSEFGYNMNQESILHILGYNVNAQENLPQYLRWRILEIAVDENILTRAEICSHLDYLINRSKHRKNFEVACNKWLVDRNHIASYNTTNIEKVLAKTVTIHNYNK